MSEGRGPCHLLTIHAVEPEMDYDVDHPWCCTEETIGEGEHSYKQWACAVGWHLREAGLESALYGIWPHEEFKPGIYLIRDWWSKTYYWEIAAYEYDGGLEFA